MPTTFTLYNDPVAYDADIRYDGVVTVPDGTPTATGNRHSAIWRPQRGRSHTHRRAPVSLPTFSGVHVKAMQRPLTPEIPVSKAILDVILAPSKEAAKAEILEFVRNKEMRQEAQPALPEEKPTPSFRAAPRLAHETISEQVAHRTRQREDAARTHATRQRQDDGEVIELLSLLEAF